MILQRNSTLFRMGISVLILILLVVYMYPLFMLISFSFKTNIQIIEHPFALPDSFRWENYVEAWSKSNFGRALLNSAIVSTISVAFITLLGSMASYPLARRRQKLAFGFYIFFISGLIIPVQLNLIPLFKMIHDLHLNQTLIGVIILYITFGLPLTIFLFTSFLRMIPTELEDSGRIDGCNGLQLFFQIVFPLLKPVTTTVVILQFLNIWNDFFLPVVFLNSEKLRTVQIAMYSFMGRYSNDWAHMFPMVVVGILPVLLLYIFLQRYIISGIMAGSVKG
jgi:raffinose/stachyose/melibiose transport system permease protein